MTAEDEKLVVGFDAVDLEMIRRGDMLGPRLGKRTYDALAALSTEVQELRAALRGMNCPRPCNDRPDDFEVGKCVDAGECGCLAHVARAALKPETVK